MESSDVSPRTAQKLYELSEFMKSNGIYIKKDSNGNVSISVDLYIDHQLENLHSDYYVIHKGFEEILTELCVE